MTSRPINRRAFISTGATMCGLCLCAKFPFAASAGEDPIDPKKRMYCGYICPKDCTFLRGTLENDLELKKEAWNSWQIQERFGLVFNEEQAICYGCKELDKPEGIVLQRCDVRACVRDKDLDCCIECDDLEACDKDLWRRFPEFKEQVIELQERYHQRA